MVHLGVNSLALAFRENSFAFGFRVDFLGWGEEVRGRWGEGEGGVKGREW